MRLLVLTEEFYPKTSGGAHTQWQFSKHAAEMGNKITVVTPRNGSVTRKETKKSVEILRPFPSKPDSVPAYSPISLLTRILYSFLVTIYVYWWAHRNPVDGIFASTNAMHWVGKLLSKVLSVPLVNYVSLSASTRQKSNASTVSLLLEWANFRFFMGQRVFCRTSEIADRIREVGNSDVNVLQGFLNEEKIKRIAKEIQSSDNKGPQPFSPNDNHSYVAFVGRMVPIKRPQLAVEVVSRLPTDFELILVGGGPEIDRVETFISTIGEENRMHLLGEVDHDTALKTIAKSDVLLITSEAESLGGVALEALVFNTPVVATPVGILPELEHPNVFTSAPSELAKLIRAVDIDGKSSIDERVLSEYSMSNFADKVLGTFDKISVKSGEDI